MTYKEKVYQHFIDLVLQKEKQLQAVLHDLSQAAANETKSTAGDKHETALAMLQIEQANKAAQMQVVQEQKAALNKINIAVTPSLVSFGSLVKTNNGYYFICTALGKLNIEEVIVYAISPDAPLAKALLGLKIHDKKEFNKLQYIIEHIS
jgi:transcription elongation GreA/GreB family factor